MTAPAGEGFPKAARIRRRREYLALGRMGRRRHAAHFVVIVQARSGPSRLGVTVSRKIGGAVERNRLKRRIREIFRRHPGRLLSGHDVVVVAKTGAADLPFPTITRELTAAVGPPAARRRS